MSVLEQSSVNELIARFPATAPVLAQFGLDLCCGGFDSLEASALKAGVELDELMQAIRTILGEP